MNKAAIGIVEIADCPNPWCDRGVQGIDHREGGFFRVSCTCGVGGPASTSEDKAVKLWNTRSPESAAEIERLNDWMAEIQMNAHQWMVAHDRLKAGKPYDLPKPADLPAIIMEMVEALEMALPFVVYAKVAALTPEVRADAIDLSARLDTLITKVRGK